MILSGEPIFQGDAVGYSSIYPKVTRHHKGNHFIIARKMTPKVALSAINSNAKAVLTEEGSFATHGANLIRSANLHYGYSPIWITGIGNLLHNVNASKHLRIYSSGKITTHHDMLNQDTKPEINFKPSPSNEVYALFTNINVIKRNYWSHRKYDILTASAMIPGLAICCNRLSYGDCTIERDPYGSIWFSQNSPSLSELINIAKRPHLCTEHYDYQIQVYNEILQWVNNLIETDFEDLTLATIVHYINEYFSVFLLYHNTYEHIFNSLADRLSKYIDDPNLYATFNKLLRSQLTDWQVKNNIPYDKNKDLLKDIKIAPLPPMGIYDDIFNSVSYCYAVLNNIEDRFFLKFSDNDMDYAVYAVKVFVLKEWKFVINKLLFSIFSSYIYNKFKQYYPTLRSKIFYDSIRGLHISLLSRIINEY